MLVGLLVYDYKSNFNIFVTGNSNYTEHTEKHLSNYFNELDEIYKTIQKI